ncbi:MAG TPA: NAD-dependent epimerase/dehydratase family protein [Bryobacteraceae bacterium]|nr:NAD-dependent epimerase/dehydratase family protein [Bryobacteraceae bacterium]
MPHPLARDFDHVLAHTADVWRALKGQQLFITGGTGFVGTWLVESFAWANDYLHLDAKATILTRNAEAFRRKAPYGANHPSVRLLEGDVRNFALPEADYSFLVHAATDQAPPSSEEPTGTFERELSGTHHVLEFARRCNVKRLLFTSSGAVYGRQPRELTHVPEEYCGAPSPVEIGSAYGEAKRASELLCAAWARQFGFTAVIARLFTFAGPRLPLNINFAVGNFVRDILVGGPVKIAGDGTAYRSYLYAADLAIWLWNLLVRGESARPYNVGSGDAITIRDLAQLAVETLSPGILIEIAQAADQNVRANRYVPSVGRVANELGLYSLISLDEQIRRMYEWHWSSNEAH